MTTEARAPRGSLLSLETDGATLAYAIAIALICAGCFVTRLLPLVDYPQHLALAEIARRLSDPSAPEHATHWVNRFTYNGLFHLVVAALGRVMPIELAGRSVVALSLALFGASSVALLRVLGRPASYAALFVPFLFSFSMGWGFVNFALGMALAIATSVSVARSLRRPTWWLVLATAALGLLTAMTHVFATLILCLFALSLAPEVAWRSSRADAAPAEATFVTASRALLRMFLALAPILVAAAWCIAVYRQQYAWDPGMYKDATLEGTSPPIWQKVAWFASWATGLHSDDTDQALVGFAFAMIAAIALISWRVRRSSPAPIAGDADARDDVGPLYLPFLVAAGAYLATPMVLQGTHLIFPRLTQVVVLGALLAVPRLRAPFEAPVRHLALAIALCTGLNLFLHDLAFARETDDASRVIDELPPNRSATAVIYGGDTFAFRHGPLIHLAAYYAARKHGDFAFSFARYLSVPVRFKPFGGPPWPLKGWEFNASDYNPRCKFARRFDLVILKAPGDLPTGDASEQRVREIVFGQDAWNVRLVSHHGRYWGFDTRGLPDDGTF
ncbi:MAG: hypothetical protein ACHREM_05175 [Polyangiales bacterium]